MTDDDAGRPGFIAIEPVISEMRDVGAAFAIDRHIVGMEADLIEIRYINRFTASRRKPEEMTVGKRDDQQTIVGREA